MRHGIVAVAIVLAACDRPVVAPTPPPVVNPGPAPQPSALRLEIDAPRTVAPAGLAGELDGAIEVYRGQGSGPFTREVSCRSYRHQVMFSR